METSKKDNFSIVASSTEAQIQFRHDCMGNLQRASGECASCGNFREVMWVPRNSGYCANDLIEIAQLMKRHDKMLKDKL